MYVLHIQPQLFQRQRVDECSSQPGELASVDRSMAAFMCQDVHQVAAFIYECLLAWMVGVDPVDLYQFYLLYMAYGQ
jgi:hypothetical protein